MTNVIPAVLVNNEDEFKEKLDHKPLIEAAPLWQFDILDGTMFGEDSWTDFEAIKEYANLPNLELHLMIEHPVQTVKSWVDHVPTVKRAIIHAEIKDSVMESLTAIKEFGIEAGLALNPETNPEDVSDELAFADMILVLGVQPGKSGQKFLGDPILEKIRTLRTQFSDKIIAVDGGVNTLTAQAIIEAGANQLCAASAIWSSENPIETYNTLKSL